MKYGDMIVAEINNGPPLTVNKNKKYCKYCGSGLSMYNKTGFCFSHFSKKFELEEEQKLKKEEKRRQRAIERAMELAINKMKSNNINIDKIVKVKKKKKE